MKYTENCPEWAECCTEYGYCQPKVHIYGYTYMQICIYFIICKSNKYIHKTGANIHRSKQKYLINKYKCILTYIGIFTYKQIIDEDKGVNISIDKQYRNIYT